MPKNDRKRTALIAGATGAVGALLLERLLADGRYASVKVLSRRPLRKNHPKLHEQLFSGERPVFGPELGADDVFCCLGTTLKKAGSKAAFELVDYHLVVNLARTTKAQCAGQFLVVSAAGSSLKSPSFYSRVKARMEQAVTEAGFTTLHILRPSLLLAEREDSRPGEWLAQKAAPLLNPLLKGKLAMYRAVPAAEVADALVELAWRKQPGVHVHHLPLAD